MNKKRVYIGLGTNTGNKQQNLTRAIEELSLALDVPISSSSFLENEAWGFETENKFLNCVITFETDIPPLQLLDTTEAIERLLGRTQKSNGKHYSDRIIDIDILFYGDEIIECKRLTVPHPLLHIRDFVLIPMSEIAPQFTHPRLKKTINELLNHNTK